jgi:hypothetical protein
MQSAPCTTELIDAGPSYRAAQPCCAFIDTFLAGSMVQKTNAEVSLPSSLPPGKVKS